MRTRNVLVLAALVLVAQAWLSHGYYHQDEYFQTVEFASHKLGVTPASDLPWEFGERIRPFLQPATYYVVARALRAAGLSDPSTALLAFRLLGAALGWTAILLLARALAPRLGDARSRAWLLAACALAWYLPFFLVRSSSEGLAAPLLAAGIALFLLLERRRPAVAALAAGIALGLAFEARYQVAFAILGFVSWLAVVRRERVAAVACLAGVAAVAALGLVLDRWGYGVWTLTPWNYLRVNLIEGRAAGAFGSAPPWYYVVALARAHAPLSTILLAAVVAFWIRAPRDALTWTTLPFFLGHTLLARKEVRFLVPLAILAAAMAALLVLDPSVRPRWIAALGPRARRLLLGAAVALDLAFVGALLLVPVRHDLSVQKRLRDVLLEHPETPVVLLGLDPFVDKDGPMPFVRPRRWDPLRAVSWNDVEARLGANPGGALVVSRLGELPPAGIRARLRLLAAPLPEAVARALARPVRRTEMKALWEVER